MIDHEAEAAVHIGVKLHEVGLEIQPLTEWGLIDLTWNPKTLRLQTPVMLYCKDYGGSRAAVIAAAAPPPAIEPPRSAPEAAAKPVARKSRLSRKRLSR
jgi:hypothetical protein